LQAFFHLLLKHPNVHLKVVAEIDEAHRSGVLNSELVDFAGTQKLAYFQAALKESMRLRPAFGADMARVVPAGGAIIHGHQFKPGTVLAMNAMALHRDKDVFGEDSDRYRPERWLEAEERTRLMNKHMYQVG